MNKNFVYDRENHIGTYNGVLIPSITQLLSLKYGDMSNINETTLRRASARGSAVHEEIDLYNSGLIDYCEKEEGKNYIRFMKDMELDVVEHERQVLFTLDNEVVAYGTYDLLAMCKKDIFNYKKGDLILIDFKTVSAFDDDKVQDQLNLYCLGDNREIKHIAGMWLRGVEKCEIRQLKRQNAEQLLRELLELWKKKQ